MDGDQQIDFIVKGIKFHRSRVGLPDLANENIGCQLNDKVFLR